MLRGVQRDTAEINGVSEAAFVRGSREKRGLGVSSEATDVMSGSV